jgi:hypothetical protein
MLALDGSAAMRERTRATCGGAAERLTVAAFDLAGRDWRAFAEPPHAIVSSLAIHHLDGDEKRALPRDLAAALAGGGVLVIADIVRPPDARGLATAALQWAEVVRAQALALDGDLRAFAEFQRLKWNYFHDRMAIPSTSRRRWPSSWRGWPRQDSSASTATGCWRGMRSSAGGSLERRDAPASVFARITRR